MTENNIKTQIKWWDKKRIWYNIIIAIISIGYIIKIAPESFGIFDVIGILIYVFGANLMFSIGILLELYDYVYLDDKIGFRKAKLLFFIIGTLISVFYTLYQIELYYFGPLAE